MWERLNPNSPLSSADIPLNECPLFTERIKVYHSAIARFYAPSDLCGVGGMHCERIRSHPNWRSQYPRRDTVFVDIDSGQPGMLGLVVAQVLLFFSFTSDGCNYPCALVNWIVPHGNEPDEETGMWVARPEYEGNGQRTLAVIHLDTIARGAHLLPVYGSSFLPENFHFSYSLDVFRSFFINRYADHHAFEFVT